MDLPVKVSQLVKKMKAQESLENFQEIKIYMFMIHIEDVDSNYPSLKH
jgi:hypothetical protein